MATVKMHPTTFATMSIQPQLTSRILLTGTLNCGEPTSPLIDPFVPEGLFVFYRDGAEIYRESI